MRGVNQSPSFTLQGLDQSGRWVVLDERHSPYSCRPHFRPHVFFVDTDERFTHFRYVPENGSTFSLSAFEIYGSILPLSNESPDSEGSGLTDETDDLFDPWSVPDYE
jgi:hypothetical protein